MPTLTGVGRQGLLRLETRRGDVVAWRGDRLRAAGFDERLAGALARDPAHDIHALIELVERGCPPALAARILAPLGQDEA